MPVSEAWRRDLRYAARMLSRDPAFSVTVVLTLALGIGAGTAVFGAMDRLLLRRLPYPEPDGLLALQETKPAKVFAPSPCRICSTGGRRANRSTVSPAS